MANDSELIDLWERDDSSSLAPLSTKQLNFIDHLISYNQTPSIDSPGHVDNNQVKKDVEQFSECEDMIQFSKLFHRVNNEMKCYNDSRFIKINDYQEKCQQLSDNLKQVLSHLTKLDQEYSQTLAKTKSFYNACDGLLQQQHGLIVAIEAINEKLAYFENLETMAKKFSSPTMLTLNESLIPLLNRLDDCINFMAQNEDNYLEASNYLADYRRFQTSALNTIRTHVINTLKQTATQVMPENDTVLTPNESVFTLYYGKFQLNAHRIKTLMQQIEHRTNQAELYSQYLNECHQCYFGIRESLMGAVLTLAMDEMIATSGRNFCSLIRSAANLYIHICRDEYQLYFQFFTQLDSSLGEFLDHLCLTLYDRLRPIVIHLEHLESLSEICSLLKSEFIEENVHQDELAAFVKAVENLLQDTQERLVYRCNIYIQTNILNYQPASGDLAYPQKLEMMKSISETISADNQDDQVGRTRRDSVSSIISSVSDISIVKTRENKNRVASKSTVDLYGMWYPTVRSTIMCLSKLYRSLDKQTFQGLSQEVLLACIQSLETAYGQIKQNKTPIDGYLFMIKYLLIVREQITPFHIDTTIKEVYLDFTRTKSAVIELLQTRSNLFTLTSNNALLKLMFDSSPQVAEKSIDSQKAVDNKIKEKCEEFIDYTYQYITMELRELLSPSKQPETEPAAVPQSAVDGGNSSSVSEENYKQRVKEAIEAYRGKKEAIEKSMSLYLSNQETEAIIFRQIKNKVQSLNQQIAKALAIKLPNEADRKLLELL